MELSDLITREQVRDLYATYNQSGDVFDLSALAACFHADGVLEVVDQIRAQGPDAIEAMLTKVSGSAPTNPNFLVRHFVANLRFIHVSADRVETRAYFLVAHKDGVDHWGTYEDVLLPSDDGWLFSHRQVRIEGARASSKAMGGSSR
ncbi:MAG: hypothetical protein JWP31_2611 [Aeromicrobium sp.]|nr:hypothetical protein [Aeromicrobium sp.]